MKRRLYLVKALGFSAIPKLLTFALTITSFPLMVRAVGAAEYGVIVYLTSIVLLFDAFAAGIVAATGKAIATARVEEPSQLSQELARWFRLHMMVSSGGLLLAMLAGGAYVYVTDRADNYMELYALLGVSSWLAIAATFIRSALTSLLAFARVAVMDTIESVLRSASWLLVAFVYPMVHALAIAGLVTAVIMLLLAAFLVIPLVRRQTVNSSGSAEVPSPRRLPVTRTMLREGLQFFGVGFATRVFQSAPLILIQRLVGAEVVGILGAFMRILEMTSFPLAVIAGAMAVRAHEVKLKGLTAIREYWVVMVRSAVVAFAFGGGILILAADIANALVPDSTNAAAMFEILSALFIARSLSDLFVPASDYVGGLGKRIVFLASCAVLQLPLIWVAAVWFMDLGAVTAVALSYVLMATGYVLIAKRVFFRSSTVDLPRDVPAALAVVVGVALGCWLLSADAWIMIGSMQVPGSVLAFGAYVAMLVGVFVCVRKLRMYPTLKFLDF